MHLRTFTPPSPKAYFRARIPVLTFCLFTACKLSAQSAAPAFGGEKTADPALVLPGTDAKDHKPLSIANKKGVVLFFVSPYCPTSNTFMPEMNSIAADFGGAFEFFFVHADADQKPADILQHAEIMKIKTTVLMDKEQKLLRRTGAKITPEAVVISPEGKTVPGAHQRSVFRTYQTTAAGHYQRTAGCPGRCSLRQGRLNHHEARPGMQDQSARRQSRGGSKTEALERL